MELPHKACSLRCFGDFLAVNKQKRRKTFFLIDKYSGFTKCFLNKQNKIILKLLSLSGLTHEQRLFLHRQKEEFHMLCYLSHKFLQKNVLLLPKIERYFCNHVSGFSCLTWTRSDTLFFSLSLSIFFSLIFQEKLKKNFKKQVVFLYHVSSFSCLTWKTNDTFFFSSSLSNLFENLSRKTYKSPQNKWYFCNHVPVFCLLIWRTSDNLYVFSSPSHLFANLSRKTY